MKKVLSFVLMLGLIFSASTVTINSVDLSDEVWPRINKDEVSDLIN